MLFSLTAVNSVELSTLLFMGDQLTVKWACNVVKSRVNTTSTDALQPTICDWRVLLRVCACAHVA